MIKYDGRKRILQDSIINITGENNNTRIELKNDLKCYIKTTTDNRLLSLNYSSANNNSTLPDLIGTASSLQGVDGCYFIVYEDIGTVNNVEQKIFRNAKETDIFVDGQINPIHLILIPSVNDSYSVNRLGLIENAGTSAAAIISEVSFPEYTISADKHAVFHYYLYF